EPRSRQRLSAPGRTLDENEDLLPGSRQSSGSLAGAPRALRRRRVGAADAARARPHRARPRSQHGHGGLRSGGWRGLGGHPRSQGVSPRSGTSGAALRAPAVVRPVAGGRARRRAALLHELRRHAGGAARSVLRAARADALARHFGLASRVTGMLVEPASAQQERDIDVLWVANIRRLKRPDRMLALAEELPDAAIHMVGGPLPGEEALYGEVRRAA